MRSFSIFLLLAAQAFAADTMPASKLVDLANTKPGSQEFRDTLMSTLGEANVKKGTAWAGGGPDFIFAVASSKAPTIVIDYEEPGKSMLKFGDNLWYYSTQLKTGTSHAFYYLIGGAKFGGNENIPAYLPESFAQPGVPQGKLSEKLVHTSKIYDGMKSDYWIYVPAQYDPNTPAALMVWQDGQGHIDRDGATHTLNVVDNLIYQKAIPVMIQVFVSPGKIGEKAMRSVEYDSMNDVYPRFLRDELLPEVYAKYNIRKDGYSRGITGSSSGGICAFNAAWRQNDQFTRVWSRIGSFTSIQWHMGELDGGNTFPFLIRKTTPKKNIRVWLQDGAEDLENNHGSWPLQNLQMANSLKMMEYDFHLTFGVGTHNGAHSNAQMPLALEWLWRGYDPSKTEEIFEQDPAEKEKPFFRVRFLNRDRE
jgi:enterochelin esterase family protein